MHVIAYHTLHFRKGLDKVYNLKQTENKISIPVNLYFTFFFFFKVIASSPQIKLAILVSSFYPVTTKPGIHELKCEAGLNTLLVV